MTSAALPLAPRSLWLAEARATLLLALPLAGAQLAQIALNIVDTWLMGRLSPEALAAGSLTAAIFYVPWLFGFGVLAAVAALVAEARGARRRLAIRRAVAQGLWVATLIALPAMVLMWPTAAILRLAGQDPANAALAETYMRPLLFSFLPAMWFAALRNFVAAMGHPRAVLAISLGGVAVNGVLAWALMFGRLGLPALGLPGAGVATSIVSVAMLLALLAYIVRTPDLARVYVLARLWRRDWPRLKALFAIGLPIGGALLAETGLFSAGSLLVGLLGTVPLAAHAVALMWASIAFMLPLGIAQAATIRVGLAAGAGDRAGVGRAGWVAYGIGAVASAASGLLFWLAPEFLMTLFLDLKQENALAVAELGVGFLAVAALFQLVDGAQAIGHGVLRGLRDTRWPMLVAVVGYWGVGFVAAALLAFPAGLGGQGVWIGEALGLAAVAVLLMLRFARRGGRP